MNTKDVLESDAKNYDAKNYKAREASSSDDTLSHILRSRDPDEERWNELFADPTSQVLLNKMAAEALEDKRAGRTQDFPISKKS